MNLRRKSLTYKIILIAAVVLFFSGLRPKEWAGHKIINNDIAEYYAYLPAGIIYHDLSFDFVNDLPDDFEGRIWYVEPEGEGFRVVKMTMGLSILFLPFFLLGHLFALISPFAADGYTAPYEAAIYISNVFFAILGLFFLRKFLRRHFTVKIVAWTLILLVFATNIFFYSSLQAGNPHIYNFALITLFLFLNEKWHDRPRWKGAIGIGLLTGLIVLIRPSNILIIVVFLLYGIYNKTTFLSKFTFYRKNFGKLALIVLMGFLVISPQLIYWKAITGNWFYFTYGNEGFFFHDPEIIKGLFGFRKGWLIYTPLMLFSIIGMVFLAREKKNYTYAIPVFFIVNVYIIYSWWAWWYGGGFGSRPMIDSYGLMAVPLAIFLKKAFDHKLWINRGVKVLLILFLTLNIWQSMQYKRGVLHYDGMTKKAYFRLFFSWHIPANYNKFIDRPDYKAAIKNIDRTESYYSDQLKPREKKLFNFTRGEEPLKNKLLKMYDHPGNGFLPLLKEVIKNKRQHKEAYELVKKTAKDKIRDIIKNDSNWYGKIKQQAEEENQPVDSLLKEHVNYMFFVDYKKKNL